MEAMRSQVAGAYGADEHLTLTYRGATVRLEAGDPRLPFIELLLFGKTLPPPLPPPEPPPSPEPGVPGPAPVVVPPAWLRLWKSLPELHRRVLVALSEEPHTSPALEKKLELRSGDLRAIHILIALRAKEVELPMPIDGVGRGRTRRRHFVVEAAQRWVLELDRRWEKVRAALVDAEG